MAVSDSLRPGPDGAANRGNLRATQKRKPRTTREKRMKPIEIQEIIELQGEPEGLWYEQSHWCRTGAYTARYELVKEVSEDGVASWTWRLIGFNRDYLWGERRVEEPQQSEPDWKEVGVLK